MMGRINNNLQTFNWISFNLIGVCVFVTVFLRFLVLILTFSCPSSIQAGSDALQKPAGMNAIEPKKLNIASIYSDSNARGAASAYSRQHS
jgi:hypothetical protein